MIETMTVTGARDFPIDMLRYEGCIPHDESDSNRIAESWYKNEHPEEGYTVVLRSSHGQSPRGARWRSFGWRVVSVVERGRRGERPVCRFCQEMRCTFRRPMCNEARAEHEKAVANGMPSSGRFA